MNLLYRLPLLALLLSGLFQAAAAAPVPASGKELKLPQLIKTTPRNIIFILTDDHRFDTMGFMGHPWMETPNLDRLARNGVVARNAFVTTSLCSPSRASILTGMYAHRHGVVDNYNSVRSDLVFFPQYLQAAGYDTAFFGKWHMGETDEPQRGFTHWLAFKGQGTYWADGHGTTRVVPQTSQEGFNIDGKRVPQRGYITDELTDYALAWLDSRKGGKPFFAYISHKAVHSDFVPADRHRGRYADKPFTPPATFANTPANYDGKPMWLQNQRNSRHGVDFGYNLTNYNLGDYHRRYCETLLAVDENVGRVMQWLEQHHQLENTLIVYMGDNGFQFGEHGLIDKRTAYEPSMRVPLLLHCPALFKPGTVVTQMVANIDIAPTLLEAAGLKAPPQYDGRSFLPLARGQSIPWRDALLYEYYWERNYPQTPTMHAVRTDRYKYIRYQGVWDLDELYDLQADPDETKNLINDAAHKETVRALNGRLFDLLSGTGGMSIPMVRDLGETYPLRKKDGAGQAPFPPAFIQR